MMTDSKPWHQAATFGEVRGSATNWSLAGDARLLLLMEKISQELISNQSEIQKQINDFQERLTSTAVQLANTENRFNHFANYKFTENRVYDHDVTKNSEAGPEEEVKGREERLQEQMPQVRAAISLGLAICESAEGDSSYEARRLPHLIGSQGFWEDASLGFFKEPESAAPAASTPEEPAMDALGPIPDPDAPVTSSEPPITNGHLEAPSASGDLFAGGGFESEEEDLFDQKASEGSTSEEEEGSEEEEEEKEEARAPKNFNEELSAKLGQPTRPSEPKKSQAKPKKKPKEEPQEEEEEEEDDGLFGRKSLFGAGGSLFAETKPEESDEDDLFASKPLPSATKTSTPAVAKDEIDANCAPSPEVTSTSRKFSGPVPPLIESRPPAMGLFDSDNDEDDIFRSAPLRSTAPAAGLTDSDEDDLFGPKPGSRTQPPQSAPKKPTASETPKSHTTPSSQPDVASLRSSIAASKAASMFSDDDDDDLFAPKPKVFSKPEPKVEPKVEKKVEVKKAEPKAEPKVDAVPSPAKIDPFAFSDSDDEDDDLFSARAPKITPAKTAASPAAAMAAAAAQQAAALVRQRRPPSSSSDDDEEEEEEEKEEKAPQPQLSFSPEKEDEDEDDLFSPKKPVRPPQKSKPAPTPSNDKPFATPTALAKPPFSMDIDEEDEDDLFSPKKPAKPQKPAPALSKYKPAPASSALPKPPFLLQEAEEEKNDLFTPKKPALPPQTPKPAAVPTPITAQPSSRDPFGFEDEGKFGGRGPLLRGASPDSESSGWSDQEPLQVKASPVAPKPAVKVDGAEGESSTEPKKKPAGPPFGVKGPSLAEIKARVKNRKSSSSSEEEPPAKKEAPAIDFSKPATATVLPSVVKNRARIQRPRRPPTRRMASGSSTSNAALAPASISSQAPAVLEKEKQPTPSPSKDRLDSGLAQDDVFTNVGEADAKGEEKKEKEKHEREEAERREKEKKEKDEKEKKEKEEKEEKEKKEKEEKEREKKEKEKEKAATLEISDSEDESLRDRPPPLPQNEEDADLFEELTISKPRASPAKEEKKARDSPKLNTDDLDIFAEVGATAKPKKVEDDVRKNSESPKPKRALATDDDDIFASITNRAATGKDPKEAAFTAKDAKRGVTTDELFEDDTDIFAHVPAKKVGTKKKNSPKVEEKKAKKKEVKEVVQEDIDDIFSTSPKAAGPKKVKAVSKKDADIFDDPLSA